MTVHVLIAASLTIAAPSHPSKIDEMPLLVLMVMLNAPVEEQIGGMNVGKN
jgi:hypothetical protein